MDARTHIQSLYDLSPDMVFVHDEQGQFIDVNENAVNFFGYNRDEILGLSIKELSATNHSDNIVQWLFKRAAKGEEVDVEWTVKTKNNREYPVEIRLRKIKDNFSYLESHIIAVIRDISARKKSEEALTSLATASNILEFNDFLQDSVKVLARVYDAKFAFIGRLVEPENTHVRTLAVWAGDHFEENFTYSLEGTPCKDILDLKEELIDTNAARRYPDDEMLIHMGVDSYFGSPMITANHMIGLVSVMDTKPMNVSNWSASILNVFATRLAVEIERYEANQELQHHKDHLEEMVAKRTARVNEQAQIIDQIHDSVVSTDLAGFVTNWNKGAQNLFGYSEKEALGQHISFIYPKEEVDHLINEIIQPLQKKGVHDTEVRLRKKNGEDFYAHLSLSMLNDKDGKPIGMIGYSMDISEKKRADLQLQKGKLELEMMNKELESFSYSVSHDLRAPLRAIDGFSQALLEDYEQQFDEVGKNYLYRIRKGAMRMSDLIDDMLQLSRVTRSNMEHEEIDFTSLVQEMINKYKLSEISRPIEFQVMPNMTCTADKRLLRIVLDNLIDNALKYSSKIEYPIINIGRIVENSKNVFYIKDNGVGFDMQYAKKLFGPFQRLHDEREFPGTGIGLATVHRVIERHGGDVWANAEVNKGATFYFTFNN